MDFTCVLKQGGATPAITTTTATFMVADGICEATFVLVLAGAGSAGNAITVTPTGLPAPRSTTSKCRGIYRYQGVSAYYYGVPRWDGSVISFYNSSALGVSPSFATAAAESLHCTFRFQVA